MPAARRQGHAAIGFAALAATLSVSSAQTQAACAAGPFACEHALLQSRRALARSSAVVVDQPYVYVERSLVADEGRELDKRGGVNLAWCEDFCDRTPGCQSLAYSAFQRACYLKDRVVTPETAPKEPRNWDWHYRTYMRMDPEEAAQVEAPGASTPESSDEPTATHAYIPRSLVAHEGREILAEVAVDLAACEKLCDRTLSCRSFAYSELQRSCHLKDLTITNAAPARTSGMLDFQTYMQADEPAPEPFGFRLRASTSASGWAWDVRRVKFLLSSGEELVPGTDSGCTAIESGHVDVPGYSLMNAFSDSSSWWGGRKDASNHFFLGLECEGPQEVTSVQLYQFGGHIVADVDVQELQQGEWKTIASVGPSAGALETIWPAASSVAPVPTPATAAPTLAPASAGGHGYRLLATTSQSGWAWDVRRVKFLLSSGEELVPGTDSGCTAIESGHVDVPGYSLMNAFSDSSSWWGGRKDASGHFFLGLECDRPQEVTSVQLYQFGSHIVADIDVQELLQTEWKTITSVEAPSDSLETIWAWAIP